MAFVKFAYKTETLLILLGVSLATILVANKTKIAETVFKIGD